MLITELKPEPFVTVAYLSACRRGGTESLMLPLLRASASGLPDNVDGVVVTSDLQGIAPTYRSGGAGELLGLALAEALDELANDSLPAWNRLGVVLAGDLYSAPGADQRGASGDVEDVWHAFADRAAWVVGVAGNHDTFGSKGTQRRLEGRENVHLLDGATAQRGGVRFGGVGGIISAPKRLHRGGRRSGEDFHGLLSGVLDEAPDVVIVHEGPAGESRKQPGRDSIGAAMSRAGTALTICGHTHWPSALANLPYGQVLNVDSRVVILLR